MHSTVLVENNSKIFTDALLEDLSYVSVDRKHFENAFLIFFINHVSGM